MSFPLIYTCPACAYKEMPYPPRDFHICPCCGTEFGYDDAGVSYAEIRNAWIARGAKWFSSYIEKPQGWNPPQRMSEEGHE